MKNPPAETTHVHAGPQVAHLRILATSDIHVHLHPWDYHATRDLPSQGLARVASLIAAARAEADTCVLVDNGDSLQGSPMGDWAAYGNAGGKHPVVTAMNHLRYDAATFGNHEFNYGLDFLMDAVGQARFPFVSANVSRADGTALVPRWTVLRRQVRDASGQMHDLRIGVIGFLPPQIMTWDRAVLEGHVTAQDIVAAARAHLPALRADCDLVIALSHSGIAGEGEAEGAENASAALAAVDGIDVVIAGHSHQLFPSDAFADLPGADIAGGRLHGKPAVMPGFWGSHLGVIDLDLAVGDWSVIDARVTLRSAEGIAADPDFVLATGPCHHRTLDHVRQPVGETLAPLNTFFAMVTPTPAVALIADAGAAYVAARVGTDLPILGSGLPFRAGGRGGAAYFTDIPTGPLTLRHASDLYCYPNTAAILRLSGAEVLAWLERAASIFNRIRPHEADQPLLAEGFPSYNFDLLHGVTFGIDLARPTLDEGGGRIRDLRHGGAPIDPRQEFHVATSSYRAMGTGGFNTTLPVQSGPETMREILVRHIKTISPLTPEARPFWCFLPIEGASVTFDTSPRAEAHLPEVAHLPLTPLGLTDRGFLRFRLDL